METTEGRARAVAQTLRFVAGGWLLNQDDAAWCDGVADDIEQSHPGSWLFCPLCAEVLCDEGCPLEGYQSLRAKAPSAETRDDASASFSQINPGES